MQDNNDIANKSIEHMQDNNDTTKNNIEHMQKKRWHNQKKWKYAGKHWNYAGKQVILYVSRGPAAEQSWHQDGWAAWSL